MLSTQRLQLSSVCDLADITAFGIGVVQLFSYVVLILMIVNFLPVTSPCLCTETVLFGGSFALLFPHLKCLIPNFPLSFSGHYVLKVHEVTMPPFLGQTLPPVFKLLNFSRENQNQEQRVFQSHQQVKRIKPHSQGSYPRHTEVNGIFPIECSGSWIQSLHPSHPCKVFHAGMGLQF